MRKVARVRLTNSKEVNSDIPGEGHNFAGTLQSCWFVVVVKKDPSGVRSRYRSWYFGYSGRRSWSYTKTF